jgi:hypothetical protein
MSSSRPSKNHNNVAPAMVRSKAERRNMAREEARVLQAQAAKQERAIPAIKSSLYALAGIDEPGIQELRDLEHVEQARAALAQLRMLTPMLGSEPDLLREAEDVVLQAQLHLASMTGGSSSSGRGNAADRQSLLQKQSPTNSTPVASGNQAGVAWAGIGNKRVDAQGVPNAQYLRNLAVRNPWVQAAIVTRKQQIGRADIDVVPMDETARYDKNTQKAIQSIMDYPNESRDSYRSFIEPVIDDILTLDRGCISKDLDARGIPHHLYYEDGATIKIYADWDGNPKKARYVFQPPNSMTQTPLLNSQLICIMSNAASYRFGLSPVQVLLDTIRGDIAATEKAMNLVRDVPPPTIIGVQGAGDTVIQRLARQYDRDVAGKKEVMFIGTTSDQELQVYPLMMSLSDMQFMEWQEYLAKKICAVFQISPQQIGLTFDINKATAQVQADITEDGGIINLMLLLEEYLNRELLADYCPVDKDGRPKMDAMNLRIFYSEVSEVQRMRHAERVIKSASSALGGVPLLTPNEARRMLGEEPFPHGGNTIWVMSQTGLIPTVLSYDDDLGDYGEFATSGELGAQDPAGGMDENENPPNKPQKDTSGDQALGNDSTANRNPPDSGTDSSKGGGSPLPSSGSSGAGPGGQKALRRMTMTTAAGSAPHTTDMALPPGIMPFVYRSRKDRRMPGKSWHPGLDHREDGVFVIPMAKAAKGSHPVGHAQALGHVKQHTALAHQPPRGVMQAQRDIQRQVKAVFEAAIEQGKR